MLSGLLYAAECWEPSVTQPSLRNAQAAALAATVWTCDQSSTHQMRPLKRWVRGAEAGAGRRWPQQPCPGGGGAGAARSSHSVLPQCCPLRRRHRPSWPGDFFPACFQSCSSTTVRMSIPETSPPASTAPFYSRQLEPPVPGPGAPTEGRRGEDMETRVLSHRTPSLGFPPRPSAAPAVQAPAGRGLPRPPHCAGARSPRDAWGRQLGDPLVGALPISLDEGE